MADTNPKTTTRTTPANGKVVLDPDVAEWINTMLFPPPDSGRLKRLRYRERVGSAH